MSNSETKTTRGGIGFLGMLAILFIGLKLTGYITWSWWWVLSPLWIPFAIIAGIGVILAFFYGMIKLIEVIMFNKKRKPRV